MRTHLKSVLAALLLASCGTPQSDSTTSSESTALVPKYKSLRTVKGNVISVKPRILASGETLGGPSITTIEVAIPLGCFESFANLNYAVVETNNEAKLLLSAQIFHSQLNETVVCVQILGYEKRTIEIDGYFTENNLKPVWLTGEEAKLEANDFAVYTIDSAEVTSAKMRCPPNPNGVSCLAVGSTIDLRIDLNGCLDHLGTVTYHSVGAAHGKVDLYVNALNIANTASLTTRCIARPTARTKFYVPMNVASAADVRLHMITYSPATR